MIDNEKILERLAESNNEGLSYYAREQLSSLGV